MTGSLNGNDALQVEVDGPIVRAVIDRPDAFNALSADVLGGLEDLMAAIERETSVRAVIITGSGTKAFCAGADLKELQAMDRSAAHQQISWGHRVFDAVAHSPVPVIAAVNGLALGGGFELTLASTLTVLSTRAAFGLPETKLGLIPGYGGTQRLPRAVSPQVAAHLMLTGERLDAQRAYELGLSALDPVEPEKLDETAHSLAVTLTEQGPQAVGAVLAALRAASDSGLTDGLAAEIEWAADAIGGVESDEGIAAFLERRTPRFDDRGFIA